MGRDTFHIAESPIQPGLERFQEGGSHSFSGQSVPLRFHPHGREFLSSISSKSTLFQFETIAPFPVTTGPCKKSLSSFLVGPLQVQVQEGCCKVSPQPFLLQAEQPQLSQPFFIGEVFQPLDHFHGPYI